MMGKQPMVRTRLAVLAYDDVLRHGSSGRLVTSLPPGEVDLVVDGDVVSVAVGFGHALVATSEGQVYGWGRNSEFGTLGIGTHEPVVQEPRLVEGQLQGKKVVQVAAGSHHSFALTDTGELYGWGMDNYRQTGVTLMGSRNTPRRVLHLKTDLKIRQVAAGWSHSALIDSEGVLYTMGDGRNGQLGDGYGETKSFPTRVTLPEKAIQVSCGYAHTVVVTESNKVYSFGLDGLRSQKMWRRLASFGSTKIVQTSCGSKFTLFLDNQGVVFASGENGFGQLGVGDMEARRTPVVITGLLDHHIVKVSAFTRYAVAFSREGLTFHWGEGILMPTLRISTIGSSIDGAAGNGILVAKARVGNNLLTHVEAGKENVFAAPGSVGCDLLRLLQDDFLLSFGDVDVCLKDSVLRAHSFVLSSRCRAWRPNGAKKELRLPGASEECGKALLEFIYTNRIPDSLTVEEAIALSNISQSLGLGFLSEIIKEHLPKEESEKKLTLDPDQECSICLLEMYISGVTQLKCGHFFHASCVDGWLKVKNQCPVCKSEVETRHAWTMQLDSAQQSGVSVQPWLQGESMLDRQLGIDLGRALDSKGSTDVMVVHGIGATGTRIKAHKAMLAARSSTFRLMLEEKPDTDVLQVNKISSRFLIAMIRFMYVGSDAVLYLLKNWAKELLATAEKFGIPDLKELCERFLNSHLSIRDLGNLLSVASQNKAHRLRVACLTLLDRRRHYQLKHVESLEDSIHIFYAARKNRIIRRSVESVAELQAKLEKLKMTLACDVFLFSDEESMQLLKVLMTTRLDEHLVERELKVSRRELLRYIAL